MTSKKKSAAKATAKKKTAAGGRGKEATLAWADQPKPYPDDLGLRWFHQKANLPAEVLNPVDEDEDLSGRLRLKRRGGGLH